MLKNAGLALILVALLSPQQDEWKPTRDWLASKPQHFWQPREGYVSTKETAIAIGTAVLKQALGAKVLKDYGKLDAVRIDDIWVVYSHPPRDEKGFLAAGGIVTAQIDNTNGAVLNITQSL